MNKEKINEVISKLINDSNNVEKINIKKDENSLIMEFINEGKEYVSNVKLEEIYSILCDKDLDNQEVNKEIFGIMRSKLIPEIFDKELKSANTLLNVLMYFTE